MDELELTDDEYEVVMRYRFASDEIKKKINDLIDFYDGKE